jgi:hypothetical protein
VIVTVDIPVAAVALAVPCSGGFTELVRQKPSRARINP